MPSPVVAASATPHEPPSTSNHTSVPTDTQSKESNDVDSKEPLESSGDAHQTLPLDSRDAIREGKEKAKAIMAASGVSVGSDVQTKPTSAPEKSTPSNTPVVNGVSQSRKRSRSGSRKPTQPAKSEDGQRTAEDDHGRYMLELYRERDNAQAASIIEQESRNTKLFDLLHTRKVETERLNQEKRIHPAAVYGYGYEGYGNGHTDHQGPQGPQFQLIYPAARKRVGHRRARRFHTSRKQLGDQADQIEELVPVRLDIEHDKIKLRDTFTWNLQDRVTPPEIFAETLVEDFQIPPEHAPYVTQQVNQKIQEQIQEYYPHAFIKDEPLDTSLPYYAYKNDEMRILVKLNITIGPNTLMDQFEWDINNPLNSPEAFATAMTKDLSLSGEFATAIAHQIREQSQMFTKSLYITGHPFDGRPIEDADVRDNFLPTPINTTFRPAQIAKEFSPYLWELNESDLQREELSILREQRRQKRSVTRRGGPALPDLKDRERTVRTLVVSSVIPGASETLENARVFKLSRASGRGRRAARGVDGSDSDESQTDESDLEEVPTTTQITGGTARTRGMRGAAIAAQGAMRATLGRSATPEIAALHHHETRISSRRTGYEAREESVTEPTTLVVKLRIPREKYRQWWRNYKSRPKGEYQQAAQLSTPLMASQNSTPQHNHSGPSSMPPPPSPGPQPRSTPAGSVRGTPGPESQPMAANGQPWQYYPDGRVDAPNPLPPGTQVNTPSC
jgi:SWI/SNF-related matrix-associated actin-dependent regulator of chromatin subfamily B protein 1